MEESVMKRMVCTGFCAFVLSAAAAPENVAAGKPCEFDIKPNYKHCTDEGDAVQLTDGDYLLPGRGDFWSRKKCVGWKLPGKDARAVTVDLGADTPLTGFSWNFAAGRAGVSFPDLIFVYVSTDGKKWRFAGDLYEKSKAENGAPKCNGYEVYRARSVKMPCHGRYVKFLACSSSYMFVDEVEVYRGDASCATAGDNAPVFPDVYSHYKRHRSFRSFYPDAKRIGDAAQLLPEEARSKVTDGLIRLNAYVMQGRGFDKPFLWSCDRWASADYLDLPTDRACVDKPLSVEMMRGETRSEAVNFSNPGEECIETEVSVEGFPASAEVRLREVVPTLIKSGIRVGGLLMGDAAGTLKIRVPAGATRQIWISFVKPRCAPGVYTGRIRGGGVSKEMKLRISPGAFPERPRLHVGGWDYIHGNGNYYRSTSNLTARIARMCEMFTDSPWAGSGVMPTGAKFGEDGTLLNPRSLDFSAWKAWTARWGEQARQYCVYAAVNDKFHGEKKGTPRFARMVGSYMRAWYDGVKAALRGRRIVLLVLDEPHSAEEDAIIVAWAKAIKAAAPEFVIFEDTDRSPPAKLSDALYDVCDIVCPPLPDVSAKGTFGYYTDLLGKGKKEIWLYSCCGPSRSFDPVVYYRAQAWYAWKTGATGSLFWAFGCGGGIADSFNPFAQTGVEYSPFFVSPTDAFRAKQSEALMEGVQDYEYLAMLDDRIKELKKSGRDVSRLEKILSDAVEAALPDEEWLKHNKYRFTVGASRYDWFGRHDHVSVEKSRLTVLRALEKLPAR